MDRVRSWLTSIGLPQYHETFEDDGWDDMDVVLDMGEDDIEKCGITKRGHVRKIKLAIDRLHQENVKKEDDGGNQDTSNIKYAGDETTTYPTDTGPVGLTAAAQLPESVEETSRDDAKYAGPPDNTLPEGNDSSTGNQDEGILLGLENVEETALETVQRRTSEDTSSLIFSTNEICVPTGEDKNASVRTEEETHEHTEVVASAEQRQLDNEDTDLMPMVAVQDSDQSDTDDGDSQHALVHLPHGHAVMQGRRPIVGHAMAIATTTCVSKSTVVKDSRNVTIAEKVEVHNIQENQPATENYAGQIRTVLRSYKKKEHLFVKTRAYAAAVDILDDQHWVVVSGNPGDGKSTIAHQLMLEHSRRDYHPVIVTSVDDWKSMVEGKGKQSNKQFVMIDDMFGSVSVDDRKLNEWMSLHDLIQDVIKERKGDLKVVCTTRRYILADIYEKVSRYKEFRKLSLVDLTESNNALTENEKLQMINVYTSNYGINEDIDVEDILETDCPYGFPHCVDMFCTNALIRQQGAFFFRRPLQLLQQEFLHFSKNEKIKFCALILLLFSPLNTIEVLDDLEDSQAMKHALKVAGLSNMTPIKDIMVALESLNKVYVVELEIGVYTFKHESFKEILSVVVTKSHPKLSIQYMDVSVLVEYTKYEGYKSTEDELIAVLPRRFNLELIQSLTAAMLSGFCSIACQHQAWESAEFTNQWLKHVTQKQYTMDGQGRSNILSDLTTNDGIFIHEQLSLIPSFIDAGHVQATRLVLGELERQGYFQSEIKKKYISKIFAVCCSRKCPLQLIELLLQKGAAIDVVISRRPTFWWNFGDYEQFTPLSMAIQNSNVEILNFLLQNGASVFEQSEIGVNVLYLAAKTDVVEVVDTILKHLHLQQKRKTPQLRAELESQVCLYGEDYRKYFISLPAFLLDGMYGYVRTSRCAIHQTTNAVIFDMLCKEGADVNEVVSEYQEVCTPHATYRLNKGTLTNAILLRMIEKKYDINQTDSHGRNLLHELFSKLAVDQCSELLFQQIDIVLKHGINVNAQDDEGNTPLHLFLKISKLAIERNSDVKDEVLDILLFHKADIDIADKGGKTPLFLAIQGDFHIEMLSKLIKLSRDVLDAEGLNSFHYLAMSCAYQKDRLRHIVSLLQEKNVDINLLDYSGCAPIVYANVDMIEMFVSKGANVNMIDSNGRTTPMNAIRQGVGSIVQKIDYLSAVGADIRAVDGRNRNLIPYILESQYSAEIQLQLLKICLRKSCHAVADCSGLSPVQLFFKLTRPDIDVIQYIFENENLMVPGDRHEQVVIELALCSSLNEQNKSMLVKKVLRSEVNESLVLSASASVCGITSLVPIFDHFRFDDNSIALEAMIVIMSSQRDGKSKSCIMESMFEYTDIQRHWLSSHVDNRHNFLIKLLQEPACLKLFVQKGLISHALWPDGIDIAVLPEKDDEAIKVLDMLASCGINIGLFVDCSMQSTSVIELVKKGRLQLLAVLLSHCDKTLKWKEDADGNTVNHHLTLSDVGDDKIAEVLQLTLRTTQAGSVDMKNCLGQTPLLTACQQKNIHPKCIHTLAVLCQDINAIDSHGQTALHYIVQHTETIEQVFGNDQLNAMLCYVLLDLLSQHARLDIQDEEGKTPLMYLLSGESVNAFEEMVEICFSDTDSLLKMDNHGRGIAYYMDISTLNFLSKSYFMRKLYYDQNGSLKDRVSSMEALYYQPSSVVYFTCKVNKEIEVEMLLNQYLYGRSTDAAITEIKSHNILVETHADVTGITVLSKACQLFCNYQVVEAILKLGADPNKTELLGYTAVHRLILSLALPYYCVLKCVAFKEDTLYEMEFQVMNTPYVGSIRNDTLRYVQTLEKTVPVDRGRLHRDVLNAVNNGLCILHVLLKHGTDPNIMDVYGKTALHYCCESPLFDAFICPAMTLLIAFGANVNAEDFEGRTPIMMCAQYERTKFRRMNILIKAGATCLNVTDNHGNGIEYYVRKAISKLIIAQYKLRKESKNDVE